MSKERNELSSLAAEFPAARAKFEMEVELACLEVIDIAKQISSAIGDISVAEAKDCIIHEFIARLHSDSFYAEFFSKGG